MNERLAIYPTARKVEDLLKRQSREGPLLGHRIMTFPQLVDGLWRECGRYPIVLSTIGERLALEEALDHPDASSREPLPRTPGLLDCVHGVIREFKSAALEPQDLGEAAKVLAGGAARRVLALTSAFADYEALLRRRRLADRHDRERIVLEYLFEKERACQRPRFLDGVSELLVAEIYDFSLLQFMIVAALIRIVGDATLTIQAEPHRVDVPRFSDLTWNRFVGEETIADKVLPDFVRREGRPGRLGFVVQHLFAEIAGNCPASDGTIRIVEAPTRVEEVEEIGRSIRRVLERAPDDGIALNRIAIVARDLTLYAGHLKRVFGRYRIPLRLRPSRPLKAATPAKLVLDILGIPIGGYRRESIEKLLAAPRLSFPAQRCRPILRDIGYIDRATRPLEECIARRRRELERAIGAVAASEPGRESLQLRLSSLNATAPALVGLFTELRQLDLAGSVADHARRLQELMGRLGLDMPQRLADDAAGELARLAQAFDEMTRAAEAVSPHRSLELEQFAALVETVLSQSVDDSADAGEAQLNGVQALEVLDARGLDFDLVFIVGLNDGGFPLYRGEDPILPDKIKLALNRPLQAAIRRRFGANAPSAPGRLLRTRADRNREDFFLFFLALSTAEREVVLSYPLSDEAGNPLCRSPFVSEVLNLLGGKDNCDETLQRLSPERLIPGAGDCFARGDFLNRCAITGSVNASLAPALGEAGRLDAIGRRIDIERRRQIYLSLPTREFVNGGTSDPRKLAMADAYNGRTGGGERLRRMLLGNPGNPKGWSATKLNELAACGFRFFASRMLCLHADEDPTYESSALETGTLAHRVLHELLDAKLDFSDHGRALEGARHLLAALRETARLNARDPSMFDLEWKNIERIADEVVAFEAADRALRGEPDQTLPEHPVRFTLRDTRVLPNSEQVDLEMRGQLDRLELYRDAAGRIAKLRVLDYKTSRRAQDYAKRANPDRGEFGVTEFQLAVYLMAAIEEFRHQLAPNVVLEAGYLVLRHVNKLTSSLIPLALVETDPRLRARRIDSGAAPSVADRVIEIVASAVAGQFDVDPLGCDEYCPFRRVCRYEKPRNQN
jgi:ATP-dependent helicase/DNAse subunit B